jgi:steroid delta-isomerase-like uncharacterized protein
MHDEAALLDGRMGWGEFLVARSRFLERISRHDNPDDEGESMGLQQFVEAWNAGDARGVAERFAPDGVRHQFALPEARLVGRDAIAQGVGMIIHAVPDCGLEVRSISTGDDGRVTVEWTFVGTHQNDFPGMPASGARFSLPGISVYALDPDGFIASENVYWDMATLMAAAGVLS